MYSLKQIRIGLLRPRQTLMNLRKDVIYRSTGYDYNPEGIDVFDEDWDNLVILDACRYDIFEENHDLPGSLEKRISRGAGTLEWLRGNFRDRELLDTVYVTANPQFYNHQDELDTRFHDVWNIWQTDWDDDLKTVHPEMTAQRAKEAIEEYPHKRILVHFNQPHGPFLGETGEKYVFGPGNIPMRERDFLDDLRIRIKAELIPHDAWRRAYIETFDIAHDALKNVLSDLVGKTVISSDHGTLLGERASPIPFRLYRHQLGYYHDELVSVPWLKIDEGPRREIVAEEPIEHGSDREVEEQTVLDRLSDLGYHQA